MARHSRFLSNENIYHIVLKGINGNTLFFDDKDFSSFIMHFKEACVDYDIKIIAFCLMSNHVHFILKFSDNNMADMFKSFGAKYVPKYNAYHSRTGPLFNGRYYSSPINDDEYLFAALRYIHYNPVSAGICDSPGEYRWSSYNEYITHSGEITDRDYLESIINDDEFGMIHTLNDEALLSIFVENSRVFHPSYSELEKFVDSHADMDFGAMKDILRNCGASKTKISKLLNIDKRKI